MPTPDSAAKKSVQKRSSNGALFDRTNDSPVIGLIPVKSPAKSKIAPIASDSPAKKSSPSPAGEDVLRAHISGLLGLPVDSTAGARKEASVEQSKQGDLRSPAQRLAPTPANSPACDLTGVDVIISEVMMPGQIPSPNTLQAAVATARAKNIEPVPDVLVIATPVGRALAGSPAHQVLASFQDHDVNHTQPNLKIHAWKKIHLHACRSKYCWQVV